MSLARLSLLLIAFVLTACQMGSAAMQAQIDARNAAIAAEAPGDYYVGRRFHIDRTHFWGYLRKPRQSWDQAKLVVFNERSMKQPDRLPETPSGTGNAYGFDHNSEYRIWGSYTGRRIYDPNSDLALQEFALSKFQLINSSPGWLFKPNEKFNGYQLFRAEPTSVP